MALIGLFFGSDTGNTEAVAGMIQKELGNELVDVMDIAQSTKADIEKYDLLILGIPTWYYGESQADWDDFYPELEKVDFRITSYNVCYTKLLRVECHLTRDGDHAQCRRYKLSW